MIRGSFINVLNSDMPVDHFSGLISVRKQTGGYEKMKLFAQFIFVPWPIMLCVQDSIAECTQPFPN